MTNYKKILKRRKLERRIARIKQAIQRIGWNQLLEYLPKLTPTFTPTLVYKDENLPWKSLKSEYKNSIQKMQEAIKNIKESKRDYKVSVARGRNLLKEMSDFFRKKGINIIEVLNNKLSIPIENFQEYIKDRNVEGFRSKLSPLVEELRRAGYDDGLEYLEKLLNLMKNAQKEIFEYPSNHVGSVWQALPRDHQKFITEIVEGQINHLEQLEKEKRGGKVESILDLPGGRGIKWIESGGDRFFDQLGDYLYRRTLAYIDNIYIKGQAESIKNAINIEHRQEMKNNLEEVAKVIWEYIMLAEQYQE